MAKDPSQEILKNIKADSISTGDIDARQTIIQFSSQPKTELGIDWEWANFLLKEQKRLVCEQQRDKLLGGVLLDLAITDKPYLVARKPVGARKQQDPQVKTLIQIYDREDVQGRLLILGAPGAGKTTALLDFADQLIKRAIDQPKTFIPIVFELSNWNDPNISFEEWLIQQLCESVRYRKQRKKCQKIYEVWLERKVLVPLLDGLDELSIEKRKSCIEKINDFIYGSQQIVVCCRAQETLLADARLSKLNWAVQIEPLSCGQIKFYLEKVGKLDFWREIQATPEMYKLLNPVDLMTREIHIEIQNQFKQGEFKGVSKEPGLLQVPLFIALAAQAFSPGQLAKRKAEILEQYINFQLSRETRDLGRKNIYDEKRLAFSNVSREPTSTYTKKCLGWLAAQQKIHEQGEFLVEDLDFSWLQDSTSDSQYRFLFGLLMGIFTSAAVSLYSSRIACIVAGLTTMTLLIVEQESRASNFKIHTIRAHQKYCGEVQNDFSYPLTKWLPLIFSVVILGISFSTFPSSQDLMHGFSIGMCAYSCYILASKWSQGPSSIFELPLGTSSADKKTNQKNLSALARFASVLLSIFLGLVASVVFRFPFNVSMQVIGLLSVLSLSLGGAICIQHLCLRIIMTNRYKLPWNLKQFLDYCVERRLLQRIGGRYRFIHRELLDHFAEMKN
ncbi:NACHT domain-containing protein [filamentous cyanobacterium LEGE 11480]|uniref:NACHT domain-containing protein n=1 Tax=Romeriopsis navalis LEGE 11480 TaxID=2777977 RepID=A0A928VHZ3_9CYAN|nr:NACHT domain-containing protein [Romeriopsis navalis]MBE9028941.1 NACHT domain-containing protein [Romeriopsis navalis LEGE 11480]